MGEGIELELTGIDLGDERLNRRSKKVLSALAIDPQGQHQCGLYQLERHPRGLPAV
jgi:hypothetical protein